MNFHNVNFLISAATHSQYPVNGYPEIAMVGRSNVGKSSLINKVLNRKNFARVSSKPGKTVTINFYDIDKKINLVDLPGYGYAKVSKSEQQKWGDMINFYLDNRKTLSTIFLLIDSRHGPSEDDLAMLEWIRYYDKKYYIVATKIDKLKASQRQAAIDLCIEKTQIDEDSFIVFSAVTGEGVDNIKQIMEDLSL